MNDSAMICKKNTRQYMQDYKAAVGAKSSCASVEDLERFLRGVIAELFARTLCRYPRSLHSTARLWDARRPCQA